MITRVVRIGVLGTIAAVGGFVAACGDSPQTPGPGVSSIENPAFVSLDLRDGNGNHVGTCSGTLISPSTVLTAGHCLVSAQGALVTKADGQTAYGAAVWHTWADFESPYAHPMHSDVGVILLDRNMFVSSYPTVGRSLAQDGATLSRVRRVDPTSLSPAFEAVTGPVHFGTDRGFPLAYTADPADFEGATDTGGALIDPSSNTIYGIVSSRGLSTGVFYMSRVEYLADWVQMIADCSPPPQQAQCHPKPPDAGSGSSSGGGSTSSSGGESSSSSGASSSGSGGWSSSSGSGGSSSGSGGSSSGSGGWSSSSGSGGSSSGSGGWSSSGGGGGDGGTCSPPPPPPPPPPPSGDGGYCSSGSSGGYGSSSGSGGDQGSSSSGGRQQTGSSSGGIVRTPGQGGDSPPLVPDGPGCLTDTCGGCANDPLCQDGLQDYGNCGCVPSPDAGRTTGPIQ
jgi:hypothetical protein